ncbi:MAG TPA: hypothetical protein DIW46_05440 [Microbacterium sp.]|nr:hypothetical protein [Microbacterium sp.]
MLNGMSDPQQPPLPPYASNVPQPAQHGGGYPAQPAQHPQQAPYASASPSPAGGTNTAGRIGFFIGLGGLVVGLLTSTIVQVLIRSFSSGFDYSMVSVVSGFGSFLAFIASVCALVFGLIGIRKVGAPHAQAGIATGLGIAGVVSGIFSFLLTVTAGFFY